MLLMLCGCARAVTQCTLYNGMSAQWFILAKQICKVAREIINDLATYCKCKRPPKNLSHISRLWKRKKRWTEWGAARATARARTWTHWENGKRELHIMRYILVKCECASTSVFVWRENPPQETRWGQTNADFFPLQRNVFGVYVWVWVYGAASYAKSKEMTAFLRIHFFFMFTTVIAVSHCTKCSVYTLRRHYRVHGRTHTRSYMSITLHIEIYQNKTKRNGSSVCSYVLSSSSFDFGFGFGFGFSFYLFIFKYKIRQFK